MNFSVPLNWFQKAVGYAVSVETISEEISRLGFDLQVHPAEPRPPEVRVAQVLSVAPHPNAERLKICDVDDGSGLIKQVVCGCPSVRGGIYVPFAPPGSVLPRITIRVSEIRGVRSEGMLCSRDDLGMPDGLPGLWILSSKEVAVGDPFFEVLGFEAPTLVFEITANRKDCLSLEGLANEWTAMIRRRACSPLWPVHAFEFTRRAPLPEGATAAFWLRIRLHEPLVVPASWEQGLRALGNDSPNPVLSIQRWAEFVWGCPLHVYRGDLGEDWSLMPSQKPRAFEGLDGQTYALESSDMIVCNEGGVQALPGILGSASSRYEDGMVFWIEAVELDPAVVLATHKRLGLNTQAAVRACRGVVPGLARQTLGGFLALLDDCASFTVEAVVGEAPMSAPREVVCSVDTARAVLGCDPGQYMKEALTILGFVPSGSDDVFQVPWYRDDIHESVDLVEEVIRYMGYDALRAVLPEPRQKTRISLERRSRMSDYWVTLGFDETVTYSFVNEDWGARLGWPTHRQLRVSNPISSDMVLMRQSLLPSLLEVAQYRARHQAEVVALFEWGRVYAGDPLTEREVLGLWISGARYLPQAKESARMVDYYDLLSWVEGFFSWMGQELRMVSAPGQAIFHPDVACQLYVGDQSVGHIGMVHPALTEGASCAYYAELDVAYLEACHRVPKFKSFSRTPVVHRDLSFWVPSGFQYGVLDSFLRDLALPYLQSWVMIDHYSGGGAVQTHSISLRLSLGASHSLKDQEIDRVVSELVSHLAKTLSMELKKHEDVNAC